MIIKMFNMWTVQLILFLFVTIKINVTCGWDTEDLELFDLVEEVNQNFYEVLGLEQTASNSDIRKAYRRLSLQYHPDKSKEEGAEERFRKLVAVSEVLRDEEKRKKYDLILQNGLPDWRQPVYYYRRVRKMGLWELSIFLFVLLTLGQHLFAWSVYWERKYELVLKMFLFFQYARNTSTWYCKQLSMQDIPVLGTRKQLSMQDIPVLGTRKQLSMQDIPVLGT
ncbi:dnaJ homolog subfamily C member 1-like, partial [Limulus polyphemus]|uniref:DnaJ homolog subfamily C member 1-like n=1 Tax=Limulus polyphemus TaxID=6850 RepID=A0ABM1BUK7_LIMPO